MASSSSFDLHKTMDRVPIDNNGRKEILEIFNTHAEIMSFFLKEEKISCPLINAKIGKKLGKGVQGAAYTFNVGDGIKKEYVVKVNNSLLFDTKKVEYDGDPIRLSDLAIKRYEIRGIPTHIFIIANGGDSDEIINTGDMIVEVYPKILRDYSPAEGYVCKTKEDIVVDKYIKEYGGIYMHNITYNRLYSGYSFIYPKGSYICDADTYPEYIIGALCGNIAESMKCINFISLFGFGICDTNKKGNISLKDYIFMEKIHGDVYGIYDERSRFTPKEYGEIGDSLLVQGLFAISSMQRIYGIQHNDLHGGNFFYEDISKSKYPVFFRDQQITTNTKYTKYIIDGKELFVPFKGYIGKVGDFGLAVKYSEPMVTGKSKIDGTYGDTIPMWRDDSYDMLFFISAFTVVFGKYSKLLNRTVDLLFGGDRDDDFEKWIQWKDARSKRPNFRVHPLRAWDILQNEDVMGEYMIPPKSKKVVLFGELNDFYEGYNTTYKSEDIKLPNNLLRVEDECTIDSTNKYVSFKARSKMVEFIERVLRDTFFSLSKGNIFFASVNLFDRYIQSKKVFKHLHKAIAVACIAITNEQQNNELPDWEEYNSFCGYAYSEDQFLDIRYDILDTIKYQVLCPTPMDYVNRLESVFPIQDESIYRKMKKLFKLYPYYENVFYYKPSIMFVCTYHILGKNKESTDELLDIMGYTYQDIEKYLDNINAVIEESIL